jgi:hypothetical protein
MRVAIRVLGGALLLAGATASAATLTVTNLAESGPGSIGQAIISSNASSGVLDTIAFDIPGTPPFALLLFMGIPAVTDPVVIDATTQPGYAGTPLFQIRAGLGNGPALILGPGASGSTVRGISFADLNEGIRIEGDGNTIESCFFGTDPTGTMDDGNGIGIFLLATADDNLIGGTTAAARNLISGNDGFGIRMVGGSRNLVRGNLIGTKLNGTEALGNQIGIHISGGGSNAIGGTAAGAGNVISGNTWGIELAGTADTVIAGNLIGTDAAGALPIGNVNGIQAGVESGLVIGGAAEAARNVISANGYGILLSGSDDAAILGNSIGTDAGGTLPLGNDFGVMLNSASTTDTQIGGAGAGEANMIAFNGTGIRSLGLRTTIRANSIHDNDALGIDHENVGPSPNTQGDFDNVQNFPLVQATEITPAGSPVGASVRIQGVLPTNPGDFTLDFYENPPCADDPREYLEGETWLGSAPLTVVAGPAAFDVTLPAAVAPGARISATATDSTGRTSEFSQRLPFTVTPSTAPGAGGTVVEFFGTNFESGLTATIGGVPMTISGPVFSSFFDAVTPALLGGVYDVTVTNPSGLTGTILQGWITDFADVPPADPFFPFIQKLVAAGITAGVGGGSYGYGQPTLRQQMAVFLLKAIHGICYVPPACTGVFDDVACPGSPFAPWIEAFAAAGITTGCGGKNFCGVNPVRRDQMAVFLLKAKYGAAHVPPDCTPPGVFPDVPCPGQYTNWIEQLAAEGITSGCGGGDYCPLNPNTRGQMAVFIVKTFGL